MQPPQSCPAEAEGTSQQSTLPKCAFLHLQAGLVFLQGRRHRTYCIGQKKHLLPNCDAAILYHVVKGPVRATESTIRESGSCLPLSRSPSQCMAQGSLLNTDLSIPALGTHQGDTDINAIHMMESSHLHKHFPLLVTEN